MFICDEKTWEWEYEECPDAPKNWRDLLPKRICKMTEDGEPETDTFYVCEKCAWKLYAKKLEGLEIIPKDKIFENDKEVFEYFKNLDTWYSFPKKFEIYEEQCEDNIPLGVVYAETFEEACEKFFM